MDFFSILLLSALLTYRLMGRVKPFVLGQRRAGRKRIAMREMWKDMDDGVPRKRLRERDELGMYHQIVQGG